MVTGRDGESESPTSLEDGQTNETVGDDEENGPELLGEKQTQEV